MVFNKMDSIKCLESDDKFLDAHPTNKFCPRAIELVEEYSPFRTLFFLKFVKWEVNSRPDGSRICEGGDF
jgi:hypothetical protein